MPKIYTRAGDGGKTLGGRVSKADSLVEALGSIDELNSWVGLCRAQISAEKLDEELKRVQGNLLTIGSELAGGRQRLKVGEVRRMEKVIDQMTGNLPKLANFIFPVGSLHVCRAVARRAERVVVRMGVRDKNILRYLNRLSDGLFTMARWESWKLRVKEEVWRGK